MVEPRLAPGLPVLAELVECVCEELAVTGAGPCCWCGLWPGEAVSWDYCGECAASRCGMGWVRMVNVFAYSTFPQPVVDPNCERPLAMQVEVGALRCLPSPPDGELPGPDLMAVAVAEQVADSFALYRAIKCCSTSGPIAVETYQPVGPQGGCVGGFWLAYLDLV